MTDEFSVWEFVGEGKDEIHIPVVRWVGPKEAIQVANASMNKPAALLGVIREVRITDGEDFCNFHWKYGEGIIFPKEEL